MAKFVVFGLFLGAGTWWLQSFGPDLGGSSLVLLALCLAGGGLLGRIFGGLAAGPKRSGYAMIGGLLGVAIWVALGLTPLNTEIWGSLAVLAIFVVIGGLIGRIIGGVASGPKPGKSTVSPAITRVVEGPTSKVASRAHSAQSVPSQVGGGATTGSWYREWPDWNRLQMHGETVSEETAIGSRPSAPAQASGAVEELQAFRATMWDVANELTQMGVKPKRWTTLSGDSAVGWQVDRVGQRDEKDNGAVIEEYWGEIVYILCTDLEVREYSWWRSERTIRGAGGTERTCGSHLSSVPANWLVGPRKGELPSKILNLPYLYLA